MRTTVTADDVSVTQRGFKQLAPVRASYGETIDVQESSTAFDPHIWLTVTTPNDLNAAAGGDLSGGTHEATAHLSAHQAESLRAQLEWMLEHHFYGDVRPGSNYWQKNAVDEHGRQVD